jgi:hypothetical protein
VHIAVDGSNHVLASQARAVVVAPRRNRSSQGWTSEGRIRTENLPRQPFRKGFILLIFSSVAACVNLTPPWVDQRDADPGYAAPDSRASHLGADAASADARPEDSRPTVADSGTDAFTGVGSDDTASSATVDLPPADPTGSGGVTGSGGSPSATSLPVADAMTATGGSPSPLDAGTGGSRSADGPFAADDTSDAADLTNTGDTRSSDGTLAPDGTSALTLVKLTGTTFGTSVFSGHPDATFDKAFDEDIATFFDGADASGGYTGIDLGAGMSATVKTIRYYPRPDFVDRMVGGKFQCSPSSQSDGYLDLYAVVDVPPLAWTEVSVTSSTACRFFRYFSPEGGYSDVAEVEFWAAGPSLPDSGSTYADAGAPLVNLSINKPATASSQQSSAGQGVAQGNDGLLSTKFCPASGDLPFWYQIDLGAIHPIEQTDLTVDVSWTTYQYRIEVSTDGSNWTTGVNHGADAVFGRATLSDNFQAKARYVRLTITAISDAYLGCFKEFIVWGYDTPSSAGSGT